MTELKAKLRTEMRNALISMDPKDRIFETRNLEEYIIQYIQSNNVHYIMGYAHKGNEVDIDRIGEFCFNSDHLVYCVPRIQSQTDTLEAVPIRSWDDVVIGAYQIREPKMNCLPMTPAGLDLVLVPGLAFDIFGGRLGRGKAYYDRFLPTAPEAMWLGVGYSFQMREGKIPMESWDVPLHGIVHPHRGILFT